MRQPSLCDPEIGRTARAPEGCGRRRRPGGRGVPWLLVLATSLACASQSGEIAPVPAPARERAAPLLWIADAPGRGALYLFGSVHVGPENGMAFDPGLRAAWERSEELVVEVDMTKVTPEQMMEARLRHAFLPAPGRVDDLLSDETLELLNSHVEERGMGLERFRNMKPWAIAATITYEALAEMGLEPEQGVDQQFMGAALGVKPIVELESFDAQLAVLGGLDDDEQDLMLRDTLERFDEIVDQTIELMDAWGGGDEATLEDVLFAPLRDHPELAGYYERVFFDRNRAMAERIDALSRDGTTRFVVLGAGHMVGSRGVPRLLADRGFRVRRVSADGSDQAERPLSPPRPPASGPGRRSPRAAPSGRRPYRRRSGYPPGCSAVACPRGR